MALISEKSVCARTFALMAIGEDDDMRKRRLVPSDKPGEGLSRDDEYDAYEFGTNTIDSGFETRAEAENRVEDFKSGKLKFNPNRKIDPNAINIHEFVLDVFSVDFTDEEHEIITLIGALDAMRTNKYTFQQAFPITNSWQIHEPQMGPWKTHDGRHPRIGLTAFALATPQARKHFNAVVNNADKIIPSPNQTTAQALRQALLPRGGYYGLHSAAEELGKARMGLYYEDKSDILAFRIYDYANTYTPEPPPPPRDIRREALEALRTEKPEVIRALLTGLQMRGVLPMHAAQTLDLTP